MRNTDSLINGIAGMHGTIEERIWERYGGYGARKSGDTFQYNDEIYKVCEEQQPLVHNGVIYNCPCYRCCRNEHCAPDFLYASGDCYSKFRKDGKSVYFKKTTKEQSSTQ